MINNENYHNILVEIEDYAILLLDNDGGIQDWNKGAEKLKGYRSEEIIGQNFRLFYTPEDRISNLPEKLIERAILQGKATDEGWRVKKDGTLFWGSILITSLHNEKKELTGFLKITRDLTERKDLENNLLRRNRELKELAKEGTEQLTESTKELSEYKYALDESAIVAITDAKGVIKHVNENFCKISKYSETELLGKDHRIINSGFHDKEFIRNLWATISKGQIWKGELKNKAKDGMYYWVDTTIVPFVNEAGKPYQYLAIRSDITERKKSEEKVLKVNRLYDFISSINKSIVHIHEERELLNTACEIATGIGQFKMAWIGFLDENNILKLISMSGDRDEAKKILKLSGLDINDPLMQNVPTVKVIKTGKYSVNNDLQDDPAMQHWREEFNRQGIHASISFPIFKFGKVIGIFGFFATIKDFFDKEEIALLEEAAGDISFALEIFEKTKKQTETEALVVNNEKKFRSLIEKSADMKTLTNREGLFIYASPSVSKVFGYTEVEFLNKPASEFFHPDDIPDLIKNRTALLEAPGKSYHFQYRLLHKKGNWIWCEGTLTNMLHEPAINAMVTNFMDISDRKIAEEKEKFDQNNLNALINNSSDLLWSVDRNFKVITFNQPFYGLLKQVTGKELQKGDDVFSVSLSQEQTDSFKVLYSRAFSGEAFTETQYIEHPAESWVEISFYPIKDGLEIIGTACHSRDITERKKTEYEREKMIADIIQRNKNFEQFAYIVSHNLRAPVANILGLSNILKNSTSEEERVQTQQFLFKAVEHLDDIVKDLNEILQIRTEISEKKVPVSLSDLVEGIKLITENLIYKEKVKITTNFSSIDHAVTLRSYLHSIFYNLISNSIKYKKTDEPPVIHIESAIQNGKIRISFKDNGRGIDLKLHKENVFGLYKRFHLDQEGKGLGLFMARTQVEVLGGSIDIKSEVDSGTEFIIELPM